MVFDAAESLLGTRPTPFLYAAGSTTIFIYQYTQKSIAT